MAPLESGHPIAAHSPRKYESHDGRIQAGDWQTSSIRLSKFAQANIALSLTVNARL